MMIFQSQERSWRSSTLTHDQLRLCIPVLQGLVGSLLLQANCWLSWKSAAEGTRLKPRSEGHPLSTRKESFSSFCRPWTAGAWIRETTKKVEKYHLQHLTPRSSCEPETPGLFPLQDINSIYLATKALLNSRPFTGISIWWTLSW
jgi:hypothetical protein